MSENTYINQIARRTVLSDDALSVLVPVMENIIGWNSARIQQYVDVLHGFGSVARLVLELGVAFCNFPRP